METRKRKHLLPIMLGTLLTVAITILTSLFINYCTTQKTGLSYYVHLSEPFEKDSVQLRICNLELQNDGDAILEDIKGMVQFEGQHILAFKLKGSPNLSIQDSLEGGTYRLRMAFLNPMEKLAMDFLLSGSTQGAKQPLVDFRARGATAVVRSGRGFINRPLPFYSLLLLAGLVTATVFSVLINRQANSGKKNQHIQ